MWKVGGLVFLSVLLLPALHTSAEFANIGLKNYYIERTLKLNWFDAWDYCKSNNMKLITLETDLENRLIKEILGKKIIDFWTSGSENAKPTADNNARQFVWASNGRPITFTKWAKGEPNNKNGPELCLATWYKKLEWNDESCYTKLNFICEY